MSEDSQGLCPLLGEVDVLSCKQIIKQLQPITEETALPGGLPGMEPCLMCPCVDSVPSRSWMSICSVSGWMDGWMSCRSEKLS